MSSRGDGEPADQLVLDENGLDGAAARPARQSSALDVLPSPEPAGSLDAISGTVPADQRLLDETGFDEAAARPARQSSALDVPPSPEPVGSLDAISGRVLEGWAIDSAETIIRVVVQFFDGDRLLGEAVADMFRKDLLNADIGDGCHAFRFILPLEIFDGRSHVISARMKGLGFELNGSPKILNTQPLPLEQMFPLQPEFTRIAAPLDDVQFTTLRALTSLSELMLAQSKAITALLERLDGADQRPARTPNSATATSPLATPPATPNYGPLLQAALAAASGKHDYLFFSIIDWDFRIQRPQQLATRLASAGSRVFYISKTFEDLAPDQERFRICAQPVSGVFEISLRCTAPVPNIYSGITEQRQISELSAGLAEAMRVFRIHSPVGVVEFPSWYPVAASAPGMLMIHDCLDHVAGFNNVSPAVVALEEELVRRADCVVVTSEYLAKVVGAQRKPEVVRNAADVEFFSREPATTRRVQGRPVIGYYGAIADWFDMELVIHCAKQRPDWHFVMVGSVEGADVSVARQLSNVEFLGEQPYRELTRYAYGFDVCIIPFKIIPLTQATNPVKVYEYLCTGKPVVATDLPELRLLPKGLVHIAGSPGGFIGKLTTALKDSDAESIARRRSWAARQSWTVRARKLEKIVERHCPKVSIVLLCFNNLEFTRACAHSILTFSDYPDLELICVDNASTDGTDAYLAELPPICLDTDLSDRRQIW